ncbi:Reticulon-like protein b13 [Thalictrum thalictroides]|uniref:Reticulon-like protein n=1 Tax=Thalictrum thalictroides TaxID=46969 RepID=A0A7J6VVV4_THATH|nr:Reticulon-like protein b13 [Thalictrum thalictroides]
MSNSTHQSPDSQTMSTSSTTPAAQSCPDSSPISTTSSNVTQDIMLWRKKKVTASILAIATVTWVLLDIYQYNFLNIASWVTMAIVVLLFLGGNIMKLIGKQTPTVPDWEISEQLALVAAKTLRELLEEGLRWILKVGAQSEWYEFAGVVGALLLFAWISSKVDFLALSYISVVVSLTVPVMCVKYEDKIKRSKDRIRVQAKRWCEMLEEKLKRMKNKGSKLGVDKEIKKIE